ncbi:MAG: hypothetical protein AB7O56_13475 [Bauldia sp.]
MSGGDDDFRPPGRRALLLQIGGAVVAASVVAVLFVLPAEYGIDPTGFGRMTGLDAIGGPTEIVVETIAAAPPEIAGVTETPFRTDTITIRVDAFPEPDFLEYKVTMRAGDTLVYSWSAPQELYYEFHGHTLPTADDPAIEVMNYRTGQSVGGRGTLVAPIDGIHGWFFRNTTFQPIEVELTLAGFYELEPGIMPLE